MRPLYFRDIFRRKFIFFKPSHTHQTTKEVQTHSHLPSRTRTYAARQEDDGRERRRDAGAPLRHARSATARARCANGRPRRRDDGKTKVSRASPAYFPGSKSYFLAGVGIFPPIFPEIENDKPTPYFRKDPAVPTHPPLKRSRKLPRGRPLLPLSQS